MKGSTQMKTSNRIRLNGSTKPATVQPPIIHPAELEAAINQNNALMQLLLERIENNHDEGTSFQPQTERGGALVCGLQDLVWDTRAKLAKAAQQE